MYEYHHLGIPTTEPRDGERYVPAFKMHLSGYAGSEFRVHDRLLEIRDLEGGVRNGLDQGMELAVVVEAHPHSEPTWPRPRTARYP